MFFLPQVIFFPGLAGTELNCMDSALAKQPRHPASEETVLSLWVRAVGIMKWKPRIDAAELYSVAKTWIKVGTKVTKSISHPLGKRFN